MPPQVAKLKDEIKKLTPPPPKPKEKPKPKGWIDLDEGPDAPPISEQLGDALRSNSTRVIDLFRSWDADGDGNLEYEELARPSAASPASSYCTWGQRGVRAARTYVTGRRGGGPAS